MPFFNIICVLCEEPVEHSQPFSLCKTCQSDLPFIQKHCKQCGLSLTTDAVLCGQCQQNAPPIDYLIASLWYQHPVNYLISQLKFQKNLIYAKILGHLLLDTLQQKKPSLPELILPVPLHRNRLRHRGFNQAIEIAKPIAKALNLRLDIKSIQRMKSTPAQSRLKAKQRRSNLKNCFSLKQPLNVEHIVLLDDVVTTGSTVYELARLLKKSGVKTVGVWTVSRA